MTSSTHQSSRVGLGRFFHFIIFVMAVAAYSWFGLYRPWIAKHDNDFKHLYIGATAILKGVEPYSYSSLRSIANNMGMESVALNPYVYLPFTGQVLSPLTMVSLPVASNLWFGMNQLFLLATLWMLAKHLWPRRLLLSLSLLLMFGSPNFTLYRTLTAGQLNLALLFMMTSGFVLLARRRPTISGATLAFAALFKLFPAIFLPALFVLNQRKAALAMVSAGALLLLVSLLALGSPRFYNEFFSVLPQMSYGRSTWQEHGTRFWKDPSNQSLNSFFSHILVGGQGITPIIRQTQTAANSATVATTLLLIAGWGAGALFQLRQPVPFEKAVGKQAFYCLTLITGLLVPSLMWDHYLVMLVLPIAVLLATSLRSGRWRVTLMIFILYGAIAMPFPFSHPQFAAGWGLFGMSFKLFPSLLLYGLALCFSFSNSEFSPQGSAAPGVSGGQANIKTI